MVDDQKYIKDVLQRQMSKKINELYSMSDSTFENISAQTGIDTAMLKKLWRNEEEISPEILAKILDAYSYYQS